MVSMGVLMNRHLIKVAIKTSLIVLCYKTLKVWELGAFNFKVLMTLLMGPKYTRIQNFWYLGIDPWTRKTSKAYYGSKTC